MFLSLQSLQEELKRVSEWIKFADQKVAFLAVYYSALFGFIISNKNIALQKMLLLNGYASSIALFVALLWVISFSCGVAFVIFTVFPRLKNVFTKESLFYYGTVSNMELVDFKKRIAELPEEEAKTQIIEQIYTNSVIANQKMKGVKNGAVCLMASSFAVAIFALI